MNKRPEAIPEVGKGWLEVPPLPPCTGSGKLSLNGEKILASPVYSFGAQLAAKLRDVGDLKRSFTDAATAVHPPINPPSWDHIAQLCGLSRLRLDPRPLASAKADRADSYELLPLLEKDGLSAEVTLRKSRRPNCLQEPGTSAPQQKFGAAIVSREW